MRKPKPTARLVASLKDLSSTRKETEGSRLPGKARRKLTNVPRLALIAMLILPVLALGVLETTRAKTTPTKDARTKTRPAKITTTPQQAGQTYSPTTQQMMVFSPINFAEAARQEALAPTQPGPAEIKAINPPAAPPREPRGVPIVEDSLFTPQNPPPSATGVSPPPTRTFSGEFASAGVIPPDTMGAVGTTHIVTVSNNNMRIQDRNGVQISRMTINAFWSSVVLEGGAVPSTFDPKIYFDRFNNRFFFFSSANAQTLSSAILIAVSATADPTGTWFRYGIDADPLATAAGGTWADYPSIGFNKNWIVAMYNDFGYGTSGAGYIKPIIYVIDKANAYTGPGSLTVSVFTALNSTCAAPFETNLGCGFTMAPAITEDNTTTTEYLVEDWDSTAAQLRLSKLTGPVGAPVLTVGTQFPQSANSWRFNALRLAASGAATAGASGGYVPQHQQSAHLVSGSRLMANDSRIQNSVLRNGSLWTTHTVMLSTVPQPAGTDVGGAGNPANPDNHSGIQWWQIDPTIETGLSTPPTQRARIEDPLADNCHDGVGLNRATPPCNNSTLNQVGEFFAFPNISVNQNNDVLIGFTQFSALSYASGAYAFRASGDPLNTMRDLIVYHPGEGNLNVGGGSGTARQNRWGDTSASQTDPLNDTDFWTIQEYTGIYRDYGIGVAGPWETWWALVTPSTPAPSTSGTLIINEFRLRGPQGVRDEFVELYNPSDTPLRVTTTDNSDGWALAYSTTAGVVSGVAVIPNGTFIPARGHLLIADNPDSAAGLPTVVYSLSGYPNTAVRASDTDIGWAIDLADNGGLALFNTSKSTNWTAPNRLDSVGFASTPAGLFKEGTGIPDVAVAGIQQTIFRNSASGQPQDTNNNVADFIFADPAGTLTAAGQHLGAPGPENLDSPVHNTTSAMTLPVFDGSAGSGVAPNFVFDPTPVTNGTAGTITVRRRLFNFTGSSISRVRFRFVDITTFPASGTVADLRVLSSSNLTVETPPAQALGGGFNSSVAPPIVTFATPIANGANIPVDFVFGVMQTGCFHFVVIAEALPGGANTLFAFAGTAGAGVCGPTAAPATISGRIVTAAGAALAGVTVRLSGAGSDSVITDSHGNYRFSSVDTNHFYTVTPSLVNYHFSPADRSFSLVADKADAVFTASADAAVVANAIDTSEYFVRQHYLDFLGREPDHVGFNYWSNQVNQCNDDADCIRARRIDVSAAFFMSREFKDTGSFVYRLYKGALGRQLRYSEFSADRAQVIGGPNLESSKSAFADAFVQRAEFAQKYAGSTTAGAFVDALLRTMNDSASVDLSAEHAALISRYQAGSSMDESRALVVRELADNASFSSAVYNQSFVLMQYFGYLRRSPDPAGYAFWLNVLNNSDRGNYRGMVCAFITSAEYQRRFSTVVSHSNAECGP